jgi:hypothetical protein
MKKIAFTSVFANVTYNDKNHRGLEAMFFKKMLEDKDKEVKVDVVGKKGRNTKDLDFYINYLDTDFSEYGAIMLQLSTPNFFGGKMGEHCEKICNDLANYKGQIYFLINDPRIPPINYAQTISDRFSLCTDSIEAWDRIIKNATYLFAGKDIGQFLGYTPKNWKHVDWFTYIFKQRFTQSEQFDIFANADETLEKEYDLVYFGDKRGSFREQQLRKYFPPETNNLLIGYKSDKVPGSFIKKLKHEDLMTQLDKVKVSFITGDEEHLDNVTTYRFYETLASNCLAAIQIEYDPEKKLIQDPVLRDLLYVSNQEDIKRLIDAYSPDLINRQRKELQRIFQLEKEPA